MNWGRQTKGTDGSAQTIVGDTGDHQRGRANARRQYPVDPNNARASERLSRSELSGRRSRAEQN